MARATVASSAVEVVAVTPERWPLMQSLFSSKGCPGFCWCAAYRFRDAHLMDRGRKQESMRRLVADAVPVGVIALHRDEPVGWCSIAPRATYQRLEKSRTMPTVDADAWTLLCLFVRRAHRGAGVSAALVRGALAYARSKGATVVEAYPWDTAGLRKGGTSHDPTEHFGHSRLFAAAGFRRVGETRRWIKRLRRVTKKASTGSGHR